MNEPDSVLRPGKAEDLEAILAFFTEVHPDLARETQFARAFYGWKYFDFRGRDTGLPSCFLAWQKGRVVGFIGCMPFWLRLAGQVIPAAWVSDWRVGAAVRGQGLGRQLLRAAEEAIPTLACVNGTADAGRVFEQHGFQYWDCGRSWLRVFNAFRYEWPRRQGWRRVRAVVPVMRRLASSLRRLQPGSEVPRIHEVPRHAEAKYLVATIPESAAYNGLRRDLDYFEWLKGAPSSRVLLLGIDEARAIAGHAIVSVDKDLLGRKRGRVLELETGSSRGERSFRAYRAVADFLRNREKVNYVELRASLEDDGALAADGFERCGVDRLWLKSRVISPGQSERWRLSLLDKDDAFRGLRVIP